MKINETDLKEFEGVQWRVEFGTVDFSNESEWVAGAALPFLAKSRVGFKTVDVTVMVYGDGREEIRSRIGAIIALCREPVTLYLDGYEHLFRGVMTKSSIKEHNDWSRNRFQSVTLEFDAYEYGADVSATATGTTVTINNPGTLPSPALLMITPTVGVATLTVSGICRDSVTGADLPVTLSNAKSGSTITLDGIKGLITEGGALKEADMWALPTLLPGKNTITLSSSYVSTAVSVRPLYA